MRVISAKVTNFASYKELNFEFDNQGLCLIQGPTGSGKSTLCDVIPWVLFGMTAKDGAADEIRSWSANEPTEGSVLLRLNNKFITIVRTRKPNDLYYNIIEDELYQQRGKDLLDTQKQINNILGLGFTTYLSGAYFHEFSQTAQFFSTSAKNRRLICEQIVDLSLATKLQAKIKEDKKTLKDQHIKFDMQAGYLSKTLDYIKNSLNTAKKDLESFDTDKENQLIKLAESYELYEQNKKVSLLELTNKINLNEISMVKDRGLLKDLKETLKDEVCKECGTHLDNKTRQSLSVTENNYKHKLITQKSLKEQLQKLLNQPNPHDKQIELEEQRTNNYQNQIHKTNIELGVKSSELEVLEEAIAFTKGKMLDVELLGEIVDSYRASQISTTISFIEDKTNAYLSEYFDAEIKVAFSANNSDKIDVEVYKDGNKCVYTQLSKGQRQLLKLCFGISVMKAVQNLKGITFNSIFLDEALDGLSDDLKIKSYRLFTNLAVDYSSVFFVDHSSELKAIAENTFKVSINNGESTIEKA